MRDKLKTDKHGADSASPKLWLIILLTVIFPPVGYYLVQKYHHGWVLKHPSFSVCISAYIFFILIGNFLNTKQYGKFSDPDFKVSTERKVQEEPIIYETLTVPTGEPQKGKNGTKRIEYEIKYLDGNEIGRVIFNEEITEQPQNEIIVSGVKND